MKKLYRKGTVHPSPPLKPDHLSFLPATILTLSVALSPEDREVLAYLISCSSSNFADNRRSAARTSSNCIDHPPAFNCYCFRCYMSYWVRWDSSPNRQLIHEIIDAYEDGLPVQNKKEKSRKERRKSRGGSAGSGELKRSELTPSNKECTESENSVEESSPRSSSDGAGGEGDGGEEEEGELGKGSVRSFVSFLGEKIWGVWT